MDGASDVEGEGIAAARGEQSDEHAVSDDVARVMESMGASMFGPQDGMVDANCYGRGASGNRAATEDEAVEDAEDTNVPASPPSNAAAEKGSTTSPFKSQTSTSSG